VFVGELIPVLRSVVIGDTWIVRRDSRLPAARTGVRLTKTQGAALRLRLVPWRLRPRRLRSSVIRKNASNVLDFPDDFGSMFLSLGLWLMLVVGAPVIAFVLAVMLLPLEATLVAIIAVGLLAIRFAGLTPWTVVLINSDGGETAEKYRSVVRAVRRVRAVNGSRRVAVQFVWR
jgi:hypothetical protein